jgi:aminoglycoside phosphotransferase (APT) family kinase protein
VGTLPSGRSHRLWLARQDGTPGKVVVKTRGKTTKLIHEANVLAALRTIIGTPSPCLRETSLISSGTAPRLCLIMDYIPGHHPDTVDDHQTLGAAFAQLHNIARTPALEVLHRPLRRLLQPAHALAATLHPPLTDLLDDLNRCDRQSSERVLIHGDAAPNNAIITDANQAVLIDYENTVLTHPGLDLGRLIFNIDLTDAPSHLKNERINAIISGYARHRDPPPDLRAWTIAAGLQIAAWRHANRTRPGVPAAAEALERVLTWQNRLNA